MAEPTKEAPAQRRGARRELTGTVVSDKMLKTLVVSVTRRVLNVKFGKYETKRAKYKVHSEVKDVRCGDRVVIVESRPLSRDKRWRVLQLLEHARQA